MLTLVNKVDRTITVPFNSIEIDGAAGDPLSTAKFRLVDEGSQIALKPLSEVIFIDETLQILPGSSIAAPFFGDAFALNDLADNYTSTYGSGGAAASWAMTTGQLSASGGASALLLITGWRGLSVEISALMSRSDYGGLAWNVTDLGDYYELAVGDASSPTANTLQIYKTVGGTRSALASSTSIAFPRGEEHMVQVTSTNNGSATTIQVSFDGVSKISYVDSSPLGPGGAGLRNDTAFGLGGTHYVPRAFGGTLILPGSIGSGAAYSAFSLQSYDASVGAASIPTHNYLKNNNFNYGGGGYAEGGGLTGHFTFPSDPTFGVPTAATLTINNLALGTASQYQNAAQSYAIAGQSYCFSATIDITAALSNCSVFLQINFLDINSNVLATAQSSTITATSGAQRFFVESLAAPTGTIIVQAQFGANITVAGSNSGTVTFTALQLEPMWFNNPAAPYVTTYPTPICDFLQPDCVTLPDSTATRYDRAFTGFIVHYDVTYEGTTRYYDIQCNSTEWLLENATLVNENYSSLTTDQDIITGIVNGLSPRIIYAATPSLYTSTPAALAYRNVPVCYAGINVAGLQFADNTLREMLNAMADLSGFIFGVDSYYNVWYQPPYFNLAPYAFSDTPNNITSFPYYDYKATYDMTQMQSAINVAGATISVQVTESWHLQDGSHSETVQSGDTVNVSLYQSPNAVPSTVSIGGTGISCAWDNGSGYGTAQSIVSSPQYGVPKLLSFPSPGYAAGTAISVTYTYSVLVYAQVLSSDSIGEYGRAVYGKINNTDLQSVSAATTQGEATLQAYAQPRVTLTFKTAKMVLPGQVVTFTSHLDGISALHYTAQKVMARSLGGGINEYEVECGVYLDDFVDFFRNTQKAINRVDHDPSAPFQAFNVFQQDTLTISDSLNIHT